VGGSAVLGCTVPDALVVVMLAAVELLCVEDDEELPPQPAAHRATMARHRLSAERRGNLIEAFLTVRGGRRTR
jgi:hypothetical protein